MKKKKSILVAVCVLFAATLVVCVLVFSGIFKNTDPIYGTFEYVNPDGSIAVVTMTETDVHFENVLFETSEKNSAYFYALDEFRETEEKIDTEKLESRIEELASSMNYEAMFNGKTVVYSRVEYIEEFNQYYYYITNAQTGEYGLSLCVDLSSKKLSIADMMFDLK